jgi:RNA polymerase sigma-70 factor (ECF subfamily)
MDRRDSGWVDGDLVALLPRLRRFACGLAGSIDRADDLVQAACERALVSRRQFEPGSRLDSWMYRIVQNLWIDRLRSEGRWRTGDEHELDDLPADDMAGAVEARIELAAVRRAIDMLPPDQRLVLMLVTVESRSYREAADILAIPIGTVMSRLSRARLALTRLCANHPIPTTAGSVEHDKP